MPVQIKICGLTTEETVAHARDLNVDFIGFAFYPGSVRAVTPERASELSAYAGPDVKKVGFFVDPSDTEVEAAIEILDLVQLHGTETPERVLAVRERFEKPVIKVLPVSEADDLAAARAYFRVADYLMFDARSPGGKGFGGLGEAFDWSLLKDFKSPLPWFLAGGLRPENVAEALDVTGARLLDVSSGVESTRGVKDKDLMTAFVEKARTAGS
ncbi:MAG: phosphoribosylanthranilate isomerase [Alphaproteobacteria bacterium]|nr:MAG: phosphoribosylanthranilate isomerase [Alphaproteobacteria bacterium]